MQLLLFQGWLKYNDETCTAEQSLPFCRDYRGPNHRHDPDGPTKFPTDSEKPSRFYLKEWLCTDLSLVVCLSLRFVPLRSLTSDPTTSMNAFTNFYERGLKSYPPLFVGFIPARSHVQLPTTPQSVPPDF
jgi:hypothetical protein